MCYKKRIPTRQDAMIESFIGKTSRMHVTHDSESFIITLGDYQQCRIL